MQSLKKMKSIQKIPLNILQLPTWRNFSRGSPAVPPVEYPVRVINGVTVTAESSRLNPSAGVLEYIFFLLL